jgi:hypothetical protein
MIDEWTDNVLRRFDRLSRWIDPTARQLVKIRNLEEDQNERWSIENEIESLLGAYEARFLDYQRPVFAPPKGLSGELSLGTVVVGDEEAGECRIPLNSLTRHLIVYAQTGHLG